MYGTYIFEIKKNIRYYFDDEMGAWVRMPLEWEQRIPEVKSLIKRIQVQRNRL